MKTLSIVSFLFLTYTAVAQTHLPVIKATSSKVSINDGGYLDKNAWTLSPKVKPDVYTADRTRKTKWVTFYTDLDSIRVKVKPGTRYNFVILLNGKDSCYTQIASDILPENQFEANNIRTDTIPFTLTSYNAIKVKAILDDTDTLDVHFDVSSFSFHLTPEAILKKTKLLSNQPDALSGKTSPNYSRLNKVSKLQIGSWIWNDPEILPTALTAHDMDGRLGWTIFEGKTVKIDYDNNQLVISPKVPDDLSGYTKANIEFIRSLPCIKGTFKINGKVYTGYFGMDTGSEQAMILNGSWVEKQGFPNTLSVIRSSVLSDARGVKYETKTVVSPAFSIENFTLTDIPTLITANRSPGGVEVNFLGNDLLKRFNVIMDFKHDCIYWKPNKLFNSPYRKVS